MKNRLRFSVVVKEIVLIALLPGHRHLHRFFQGGNGLGVAVLAGSAGEDLQFAFSLTHVVYTQPEPQDEEPEPEPEDPVTVTQIPIPRTRCKGWSGSPG